MIRYHHFYKAKPLDFSQFFKHCSDKRCVLLMIGHHGIVILLTIYTFVLWIFQQTRYDVLEDEAVEFCAYHYKDPITRGFIERFHCTMTMSHKCRIETNRKQHAPYSPNIIGLSQAPVSQKLILHIVTTHPFLIHNWNDHTSNLLSISNSENNTHPFIFISGVTQMHFQANLHLLHLINTELITTSRFTFWCISR